ncbi:hypothetical protein BYT27DRAFT_7172964 [Phlegmacium glaucopus]|nr:hypothetical protein BYT27DRAFT_7172964 [Phlegmacium glaucopus]
MASLPKNNKSINATDSLPEQRHAGKVGYGPTFTTGPTLGDKIMGLKEEIAGKLTRNPEKVKHGHDILTGEEKRKKLTGEVCNFYFYLFGELEIKIRIIRMNPIHLKTQSKPIRRREKERKQVRKTHHRTLRLIREQARWLINLTLAIPMRRGKETLRIMNIEY